MPKNKFGLIGKNISYSFSKSYFSEKFKKESLLDHEYVNFDVSDVTQVSAVFQTPYLKGVNVTIPYKESIISFLDDMDQEASQIGAVNTIKLIDGKKKGYNTDYVGFRDSIKPKVKENHKKALVLGTGGASKAVFYALRQMGIAYTIVSRHPKEGQLTYDQLTKDHIDAHHILVNTTPLGTHPNVSECPNIPYEYLTSDHLVYDLVYNPEETLFLKKAKTQGAEILNGYNMLVLQAEKAWDIWNC